MSNQENPFPYYVGVHSLEELANKDSRVCVMNILGNESSTVTPVSHVYSNGNVVAGVHYGRGGGKLETSIGDVPVYGSVQAVVQAGERFDTGVIYLPPAAVNHAVSELCAHNPDLKKIIILTEKVSVRDAMQIRYGCQLRKVDVFGANCLGIANAWEQVRLGGALGGDKPKESLVKGSVAIYSNSGNFSTTISEYLKTAGFGVSTVLSSGKDVYIHFGLAEFLYCAENDPRTKCIVAYIEPGGYYEKIALDMIQSGKFKLTKPIISCVTGRWKKNITRSCGHAGALAGSGDDAEAKEEWFDEYTGTVLFDPKNPKVSEKGVRIESIQEIPLAVAAVMEKIGVSQDFEPRGDLSLKPWFANDHGKPISDALNLSTVTAMEPYAGQIEIVSKQVGAQLTRENMRNKSGASVMNPKTQVTELHGIPVLDLVDHPYGATCIFSITKRMPSKSELPIAEALQNYFVSRGSAQIATAQRGRKNGATPNAYLASELLLAGNEPFFKEMSNNTKKLIDLFFVDVRGNSSVNEEIIAAKLKGDISFEGRASSDAEEKLVSFFEGLIVKNGFETIFTKFASGLIQQTSGQENRPNSLSLIISSILVSLAWAPLTNRRIVRRTVEDFGTYLALNGMIVGLSATTPDKNSFWKALNELSDLSVLEADYTTTCFHVLFSRDAKEKEHFALNAMLNLTVTNGPGTLSAKGTKESISAKNNISTAYAGFMTNTGIAHGGNGFEAVAFLMKEFSTFDPYKASETERKAKLAELALKSADEYLHYKKLAKASGNLQYKKMPCVNHPVFKGKPINIDPREEFIWNLFNEKEMNNPFQEFYHYLVQELYKNGATKNVFCVNIDAVIATISLELFWDDWKAKLISEKDMQDIVFTMFLFARMAGTAAEISDHLSRGTDMDCRTPASQVGYIG